MTQLERANRIRARFHEVFPDLSKTKDELHRVLDDIEKVPDGSVSPLHRVRLKSVLGGANDLLLALLFPT